MTARDLISCARQLGGSRRADASDLSRAQVLLLELAAALEAAQREPIGYVVASDYDGETNLAYDGLFSTREEAETAASRALGQRDRTVHPVLREVAV